MRILFVTQGYAPALGGTERVVQRLAEELVRGHGDEVSVFTTDRRSAESFPDPRRPGRIARPALAISPDGGGDAGARTGLTAGTRSWSETRDGVRLRRFPVVSAAGPLLRRMQRVAYRLRLPGNDRLRCWYQGPIVPGLGRAIREEPADVVVASSMPLLHVFTALRAARASGRPCVIVPALHPGDAWGFDRPMIDRALREADRCVAYTSFEKAEIERRGAAPERVVVVPPGVDPAPLATASEDAAAIAATRIGLGWSVDAPVIGYVGQLAAHKGVDTLIAAMAAAWDAVPDARLLIAGARGTFGARVEAQVAALPAARRDHVRLVLDFAEDRKAALLAAIDVFAYPSRLESFGVAFLEAWAAGKPVIGCASGAVPAVVRDGVDGLLVPAGDPGSLAAAIRALVKDPARAAALGAEGRRKVWQRHLWRDVSGSFRDVLEGALSAPGRPGAIAR